MLYAAAQSPKDPTMLVSTEEPLRGHFILSSELQILQSTSYMSTVSVDLKAGDF